MNGKHDKKTKQGAGKTKGAGANTGPSSFSLSRNSIVLISLAVAALSALYVYVYFSNPNSGTMPVLLDPDAFEDATKFRVMELPGRGKGLIALRDIEQGELLIRERPLFLVPPSIESSPSELVGGLVRKLNDSQKAAFWNLSYVNLPQETNPQKNPDRVALAIFETNAVSAGQHVGIFPRMARLNHGCSRAFNVVYHFREQEGALVVHALKPIKKGQELLTTYINTKQRRHDRRSILRQHYGFYCTCQVCALNDEKSRESDDRLMAITAEYSRLAGWGKSEITGAQAIQSVNKIWTIEEEEGYWSERGQLAADAALVAASHSDDDATIEWSKLALKWYTYELGADSDLAQSMKQTLANPRLHRSWGTRERQRVGVPAF